MKLGDVLYFPDYEFANGGHADKLFIVFSDPEKENKWLLNLRQQKAISEYAISGIPFILKSGRNGLSWF